MSKAIPNWLYKRATLTPNRIAIEFEQQQFTFYELHVQAETLARKLSSIIPENRKVVACLLENGAHTVALIHALSYIGAVIVPLNTRLTAAEIEYQLRDSNASVLVYDEVFSEKADASSKNVDIQAVAYEKLMHFEETNIDIIKEIDLNEQHTLMYTSGTTGFPKGVILTFGNHWWSAIGSSLNLGLYEHDKWLCAVPMFHMSGLSIILRSVIYGIPIVIHKSFQPEKANDAIIHQGVTIVSVVSAMLSRMLDTLTTDYPSTFRCMLLGGGPAPLPLLEACTKRNIPVYQTYGMTETASQIATLSSEYMLTKIGSAGKPLFHSQLKIMQNEREAKPNEVGEIVVKGPTVTKGYLGRKKETENAIKDGWLYTGDLGYLDEDGFLYVLDRRSDLIISGGENVYPAEIESVLLSHPDVAEAGVTGVDDEKWGQVPIAFVVSKANIAEQELIQFCEQKLARYKLPKQIHFVKQLPRNSANKLLRRELIKLLPERRDR